MLLPYYQQIKKHVNAFDLEAARTPHPERTRKPDHLIMLLGGCLHIYHLRQSVRFQLPSIGGFILLTFNFLQARTLLDAAKRAASGRFTFARAMASTPFKIVNYMSKHDRNTQPSLTSQQLHAEVGEVYTPISESELRAYLTHLQSPDMSETQKMETIHALYELLTCLWGDASYPMQIENQAQ